MKDDPPTPAEIAEYLGELFRYHIYTGMKDHSARFLMMTELDGFKSALPPQDYQELRDSLRDQRAPFYRSYINTADTNYVPEATMWLARMLWRYPQARFDDFRAECMANFDVSGGTYKFKTWPDARRLAGLGEAKAGQPSKQRKKSIRHR